MPPTGAALLAVRLFEVTGDLAWLDRAEVCLERTVAVPEAGLQVGYGRRTLPYLDGGTAGVLYALSLPAATAAGPSPEEAHPAGHP